MPNYIKTCSLHAHYTEKKVVEKFVKNLFYGEKHSFIEWTYVVGAQEQSNLCLCHNQMSANVLTCLLIISTALYKTNISTVCNTHLIISTTA